MERLKAAKNEISIRAGCFWRLLERDRDKAGNMLLVFSQYDYWLAQPNKIPSYLIHWECFKENFNILRFRKMYCFMLIIIMAKMYI